MKNYCQEDFTSKLENVDWSSVLCSEDVNENWYTFTNVFTDILNTVAPVKEIRLKTRTEPWMNSEILELIHERDILLQNFKKNNNEDVYRNFCKLRNKVQRMVKKAKSEYIAEQVQENRNEPKNLWKQLKYGLQKQTKRSICCS